MQDANMSGNVGHVFGKKHIYFYVKVDTNKYTCVTLAFLLINKTIIHIYFFAQKTGGSIIVFVECKYSEIDSCS